MVKRIVVKNKTEPQQKQNEITSNTKANVGVWSVLIFCFFVGCVALLDNKITGGSSGSFVGGREFEQCACIYRTMKYTIVDRAILTNPSVSKSFYCFDYSTGSDGELMYFQENEWNNLKRYSGHLVKFRANLVTENEGYGNMLKMKNVRIIEDRGYSNLCDM